MRVAGLVVALQDFQVMCIVMVGFVGVSIFQSLSFLYAVMVTSVDGLTAKKGICICHLITGQAARNWQGRNCPQARMPPPL